MDTHSTTTVSSQEEVYVHAAVAIHNFTECMFLAEYIVYDVKQVKMKYLARVKFNFK